MSPSIPWYLSYPGGACAVVTSLLFCVVFSGFPLILMAGFVLLFVSVFWLLAGIPLYQSWYVRNRASVRTAFERMQQEGISPEERNAIARQMDAAKEEITKGDTTIPFVLPDQEVVVQGICIRGMVYAGTGRGGGQDGGEPSLLDDRLRVEAGETVVVPEPLPSYAEMTPHGRYGYLLWLANGRKEKVASGYVRLFCQGLEYWALVEARVPEAAVSIVKIWKEILRLGKQYRHDPSLALWLKTLADAICLRFFPDRFQDVSDASGSLLGLQCAIAVRAGKADVSLPSGLALAWARMLDDGTPAMEDRICRSHVDALFTLRFGERFKGGMGVPEGDLPLTLTYLPDSPRFRGVSLSLAPPAGWTDATRMRQPVAWLSGLLEESRTQLSSYARFLDAYPEKSGTLESVARLPVLLLQKINPAVLAAFRNIIAKKVPKGGGVMEEAALSGLWEAEDLTAGQGAHLLQGMGYGIMPDPRIVPDMDPGVRVLYREDTQKDPDPDFLPLLLFFRLGMRVGFYLTGDLRKTRRHLDLVTDALSDLTPEKRRCLKALTAWEMVTGGRDPEANLRMKRLGKAEETAGGRIARHWADRAFGVGLPRDLRLSFLMEDRDRETRRFREPDPVHVQDLVLFAKKYQMLLFQMFGWGRPEEDLPVAADDTDADIDAPGFVLAPSLFRILTALSQKSRWLPEEAELICLQQGQIMEEALEAINNAAVTAVGAPVFQIRKEVCVKPDVMAKLKPFMKIS